MDVTVSRHFTVSLQEIKTIFKSKASLIWAQGTMSGSSPGYHSTSRGWIDDVTPNAGYKKTLHIPPSDHDDDHGDHSDPDHVHEGDETEDDGHDHDHHDDDGHDHGEEGGGKDCGSTFGTAAALGLTSLFFSF